MPFSVSLTFGVRELCKNKSYCQKYQKYNDMIDLPKNKRYFDDRK
jgi:hypothetical protein